MTNRLFAQPVAAKVPEIIFLFWVTKILTTAGGEATSDYLKTLGNIGGGGAEARRVRRRLVAAVRNSTLPGGRVLVLGLCHRHLWHRCVRFPPSRRGIPYAGTTLLWAVMLIAVLWLWHRNEGTLSIHSITTQRREAYYWTTVLATFALGTALGDFTATSLSLGYLASGSSSRRHLHSRPGVVATRPKQIAAFWMAYIVTRPLGASFADYISKPANLSGIGFGDGTTAVVFTLAVAALVLYLAVVRPDIQPVLAPSAGERPIARTNRAIGANRPEGSQPAAAQPLRGGVASPSAAVRRRPAALSGASPDRRLATAAR